MCTMSVAQVYIYTVKQVIFTRCKFLEILQEGLMKVSASRCSFDCGFIVTISKCNLEQITSEKIVLKHRCVILEMPQARLHGK